MSKGAPSQPRDIRVEEIASRQHGVATSAQLAACGLTSGMITYRVHSGRLHRVHRGVYAVGHRALTREAGWMAAVLACGEGAALSHLAAAALWDLLAPANGRTDVTVPTHNGRKRRDGVRIHRCAALAGASLVLRQDEEPIPATTKRDGIPVTAPWRTIDDLRRAAADPRAAVTPRLYRRAMREAELRRLALSPQTPRDRTRSEVEREFLALCRKFAIPAPEVNVQIGGWTVDFLWPASRLVVETDSWATHGGSVAFEEDRRRDLDLRRRGLEVRRYTDRQIEAAPDAVAADLRSRLDV
ncbi:MAG: type IV toxin-antitoxin system AbiEi family antitoxin domain-containing protein [Solirubrobacterales bacterium]